MRQDVIFDTVKALNDLRQKAIDEAGPPTSEVAKAATAPPEVLPIPIPPLGPPPPPASTTTATQPPRPPVPIDISGSFRYPRPETDDEENPPRVRANIHDNDPCRPFKQYQPLDSAGRATGARAQYCSANDLLGGWEAPESIYPTGWSVDQNGHPSNPNREFSRGHLIATSLGGDGRLPESVFTIYQATNNSAMRHYERMVQKAVQKDRQRVYYEVRPVFLGHASRASAVHIFARGSGGLYFDVTIQNTDRRKHRIVFPWIR